LKIDFLSDLHGYFPETPGGDVLILCGDYTASDKSLQWDKFFDWVYKQPYEKKIMIGGNHDNFLQEFKGIKDLSRVIGYDKDDTEFEYLCDSGTQIDGIKIWGTPWTKTFPGINPRCCAFTKDLDIQMKEKFDLIPNDIDILVSHGPPFGILDKNEDGHPCGSIPLLDTLNRVKPLYMVFGHIHEEGGKKILYKHIGPNTWCMNVSYVDERYKPKNEVTRIYMNEKNIDRLIVHAIPTAG